MRRSPPPDESAKALPAPWLSIPSTLRLGLFRLCLGFSGRGVLPVLLNRVMLRRLGFPQPAGGWSSGLSSRFVAPPGSLFGQISIAIRFAGPATRTPTSVGGAACFCADWPCLVVPLHFPASPAGFLAQALHAGRDRVHCAAVLRALFACYGLAVVDGQHGLPGPGDMIAPPSKQTLQGRRHHFWVHAHCRDCHCAAISILPSACAASMGGQRSGRC